ncbi:MAG TPA: FAD-dependent oxidoreductase [Tetragenococcus sp.]|nr:FAD-dependent oxidoreductase [Tetragenococcus sp.]
MFDLIIIGGGPAGMAAAVSAYDKGVRDILIIERDHRLGGILNQCIHNGFGLHYFKEELTGPEYAERFIDLLQDTSVHVLLDTMALEITPEKQVHIVNKADGYQVLQAKSLILSMGCRERTRGAIGIPGSRPAGIMTAGVAQRYANMEGYLVGKRVIILGSGDIGLIMARRMTLEGAEVLACVEVMPYSGGLNRNIVQCLDDFDIPLYLSHTITDIKGKNRVEKVIVSEVDQNRKPIVGTEMEFDCDTVLLSVGLIPENELSRNAGVSLDRRTHGAVVAENMETSVAGVFACGNVVHVHDLVDFVTEESIRAGQGAAHYLQENEVKTTEFLTINTGTHVTYTVPQKISKNHLDKKIQLAFRVNQTYDKSVIRLTCKGQVLKEFKRDYMAPGEMEKIKLSKKLLQQIQGDEIEISVDEVRAS